MTCFKDNKVDIFCFKDCDKQHFTYFLFFSTLEYNNNQPRKIKPEVNSKINEI